MPLNQCQQSTLQINTIKNPKNGGCFLDITTRSGKTIIYPLILIIIDDAVQPIIVNDGTLLALQKWWLIRIHLADLKMMIPSLRQEKGRTALSF